MTLDDITIRTHLLPGDLGYIAYLHGRIYARECNYTIKFERYVLEGLAEMAAGFDEEKDRVWVCEHNGTMVGFLAAVKQESGLQLRFFLIVPSYRALGLGTKLMENFIAFMREKEYTSAFLWTTHEQTQAHKLYERFGFVLTHEIPSDAFGKSLVEQRFDLGIRGN